MALCFGEHAAVRAYYRGEQVSENLPPPIVQPVAAVPETIEQIKQLTSAIDALLQRHQPAAPDPAIAIALREVAEASQAVKTSVDEMSRKLDLPVRPVFGKDGRLKGVARG